VLEQKIYNIKTQIIESISRIKNSNELAAMKVGSIGRKSELTKILKELKNLSIEDKKKIGKLANIVKQEIEALFEKAEREIKTKSFDLEKEKIDITIPANRKSHGHLHILSKVQYEIEDIFTSMGFEIADGPEIETEFYNFDALNIPEDHPSRDEWDTFWIKTKKKNDKVVLRTHTSPVQIRYMQENNPPFRIIVPGRCFRNEATDSNHEHTFNQFEALMVGDDINVGHFKHIGEQFFSRFFKKDIKIRLRPSFFPFTEPSFEFDISCTVCDGKGCSSCGGGGWLEIGGAGIVNQEVFVASGYPRNRYQGFAWGFGIERLAMMRYKVDDIRLFHSGDLRFINQF